jgi:hypothetical protein
MPTRSMWICMAAVLCDGKTIYICLCLEPTKSKNVQNLSEHKAHPWQKFYKWSNSKLFRTSTDNIMWVQECPSARDLLYLCTECHIQLTSCHFWPIVLYETIDWVEVVQQSASVCSHDFGGPSVFLFVSEQYDQRGRHSVQRHASLMNGSACLTTSC